MSMGMALLLNILIGIVWYALQPEAGPGNFVVGLCVGFVLLALLHRPYGSRTWAAVTFAAFEMWSIFKSSIRVAAIVLRPKLELDPGIVAIPLTVTTDFEIALLATSLTLTPGSTLTIDIGHTADGQRVLYVHNLIVGDPDALRKEVKQEVERRILRFTQTEGPQ